MSKVIEILDSDEDIAEPLGDAQVQTQPAKKKLASSTSTAIVDNRVDPIKQISTVSSKTTKEVITNTPSTTKAPESPTKTRSRHRRKSSHQLMRASPDMQFETISLDDEDDEIKQGPSDSTINSHAGKPVAKAAKIFKTTPKILGTKSLTSEEAIETDFEDFLASDEINTLVRQIAEERIRINFLLASYGMPDISFALYSNYERLKFQFDDRVKQRKMRSWNRAQDTKMKKRRTQEET